MAISNEETLERSVREYLNRFLDVTSRWTSWLAEHERAVVTQSVSQVNNHVKSAEGLFDELDALSQSRSAILADAKDSQFEGPGIARLARSLKAWRDPKFRQTLALALRRVEHLKRLNLAAWVLVSQCARLTNETVNLFNFGKAESSVYINSPSADDRGGQLLDANA